MTELFCYLLNLDRFICEVPLNKEVTFDMESGLMVWLCCLKKVVNLIAYLVPYYKIPFF